MVNFCENCGESLLHNRKFVGSIIFDWNFCKPADNSVAVYVILRAKVYNEVVWLPPRNIHIIAKSPACTRRSDVACTEQIYFQHIWVDYVWSSILWLPCQNTKQTVEDWPLARLRLLLPPSLRFAFLYRPPCPINPMEHGPPWMLIVTYLAEEFFVFLKLECLLSYSLWALSCARWFQSTFSHRILF